MPENPENFGKFKIRCIIFLTLQVLISLFFLLGLAPVSLDFDIEFVHNAVRPILLVLVTINFLWFISSISALICVLQDQKRYLRFHIYFNSVITFIYFCKLIILLVSINMVTSILCIVCNFVNFCSVFYEIKLVSAY
ncbi:uncharacterized protein CELE_K02E7.11 [Caenorhabditis elegans]|uniref:Uncharacterized protein n=1 Tax=Caenorhabditis elegans TaxID=6239 RepID=O17257_CAEEL|nr:Uncharacterized protein CELE_K02E7.11 [Caenorhabditis elegans]CCD63503.1 Uncharacterized protein CELE_K02E7.11 [Caenorhabditis elegans]|eukprot:NP_493906.1 Uncharacterized protein CELE_K02E7.11 [Caenorhabditis elegans]